MTTGHLLASRYAPLGTLLTFVSPGLYPAYLNPADARGFLPLIRGGWGLSPAVDQQLGGLIMWVPGGLVYLCAMIATLARWYSEADTEDEPAPASRSLVGSSRTAVPSSSGEGI